jgi:Mn2+/Fe2+ NRAMP family transporter
VLAGSAAYALAEAFGWHEGLGKSFRQARGFYLVIVAAMAIGLAMNFGGLDPIRGLYFAAILNGLAAPPLILLMSCSRTTIKRSHAGVLVRGRTHWWGWRSWLWSRRRSLTCLLDSRLRRQGRDVVKWVASIFRLSATDGGSLRR